MRTFDKVIHTSRPNPSAFHDGNLTGTHLRKTRYQLQYIVHTRTFQVLSALPSPTQTELGTHPVTVALQESPLLPAAQHQLNLFVPALQLIRHDYVHPVSSAVTQSGQVWRQRRRVGVKVGDAS